MYFPLFLLAVFLSSVSSQSLFQPEKSVIATDHAEVKLVEDGRSRSKRDSDDADYLLSISAKGRFISARLKRSDVTDTPVYYDGVLVEHGQKDWGAYTSEDVDGHFIVSKGQSGHSVEGYMRKDGESYLLQPSRNDGDHVIHTLGTHTEEDEPKVKRAAGSQYTVEIYAVSDKAAIDLVKLRAKGADAKVVIQKYFAMQLLGMNRRYTSLSRYGVNLNVRGVGLDIKETEIPELKRVSSSWGVEASKLLVAYNAWIVKRRAQVPKYDYTVLLTGKEMYDQRGNPFMAGMAFHATICTKFSTGVIEFGFTMGTVRLATHELGHSLGARHVWMNGCPNSWGIMSYRNYLWRKKNEWWKFSSCSANEIRRHLYNNAAKVACLLKTSGKAPEPKEEYLGSTMTVDEQCQRASTKKYKYISFARNLKKTRMCEKFYCLKTYSASGRWTAGHFVPLPGTSCADRKWCVGGNCVSNAKAPSLDAKCPFGDDPTLCKDITNPSDCAGRPYSFRAKVCCNKCKK